MGRGRCDAWKARLVGVGPGLWCGAVWGLWLLVLDFGWSVDFDPCVVVGEVGVGAPVVEVVDGDGSVFGVVEAEGGFVVVGDGEGFEVLAVGGGLAGAGCGPVGGECAGHLGVSFVGALCCDHKVEYT
jgi:hypothetical protein